MKREYRKLLLTSLLLVLCAGGAWGQGYGEWGDAPEGALAYPSLAVIGSFPTCLNVAMSGFIWHSPATPWAFFGPSHEMENEGNASLCASFNPYDADECWQDGDAGLLFPPAYTIVNSAVVPCVHDGYLGPACTNAQWGANLDIFVTNTMPVVGYVNVLMDWDQNGVWAGSSNCPGGATSEHVLVDFVVPVGYAGPLSGLAPPGFLIGPNAGFVWTRFTITEAPVGAGWIGSGVFEDGETEDYLLQIEDGVPSEDFNWGSVKNLYR